MTGHATPILFAGLVLLVGCSSGESSLALTEAINACSAEVDPQQNAPESGLDRATNEDLTRNAAAASARADAAQRAADLDMRWASLAEAMDVISTAADAVLAAEAAGQSVVTALTPAEWDTVKEASNISILECEAARTQKEST